MWRASTVKRHGRSSLFELPGKKVRHEPIELIGALDRHQVRRSCSADDLKTCARDGVGNLAGYPGWRQQILLPHDYQGRSRDRAQPIKGIELPVRIRLSPVPL